MPITFAESMPENAAKFGPLDRELAEGLAEYMSIWPRMDKYGHISENHDGWYVWIARDDLSAINMLGEQVFNRQTYNELHAAHHAWIHGYNFVMRPIIEKRKAEEAKKEAADTERAQEIVNEFFYAQEHSFGSTVPIEFNKCARLPALHNKRAHGEDLSFVPVRVWKHISVSRRGVVTGSFLRQAMINYLNAWMEKKPDAWADKYYKQIIRYLR